MNHHHHFLSNSSYMDPYHQPQQQPLQQYYNSPLQLPSVISKQENVHASSAMGMSDLIYQPNLPFDPQEFFQPDYNGPNGPSEYNGPNGPFWFIDL